MLHDTADFGLLSIWNRVHVKFVGIFQKAVQEHGMLFGGRDGMLHVVFQGLGVVDDFHGPAAQNVWGSYDQWKPDAFADLYGPVNGCGGTILRMGNIQRIQQGPEAIPIFSQVDRIRWRPPDRHTGFFQGQGQLQGGLAAELNDDTIRLFEFRNT